MSGKTLTTVAPIAPDALPVLEDDQGAAVVPRDHQELPLRAVIEKVWDLDPDDPPGSITKVQFLWDDELASQVYEFEWPFDPAVVFPFEGSVPQRFMLTAGVHRLSYRVTLWSGNSSDSPALLLNVDREAPNRGGRGGLLVVEDEVLDDGVSDAYLERNQGVLPAGIPRWPDIRLQDRVEVYLGASADPSDPGVVRATSLTIDAANLNQDPVALRIPRSALESVGNGYRYAFYFLKDKAENEGVRSRALNFLIALGGVVLPRPLVPLADSDGLIDLQDARSGVAVLVPFVAELQPDDEVHANWNGRPLPVVKVATNQVWPLRIPVVFSTIAADGFAAAVPCSVSYRATRSGLPLGQSSSNDFLVDLTVAGPDPDPIDPDPINPRLPPVVVKGVTGDNVLVIADRGLNARVEVELFQQPEADDLLELYWGSYPQIAATYRVRSGDQAGDIIAFSVPWSIIEAVGNAAALPVFYWTYNGINRQRAPQTPVMVRIETVELPAAGFADASIFGWIRCDDEPWQGVRVWVPVDGRMAENDRLTLTWTLCRTTAGEQPIPGAEAVLPFVLSALDLEPAHSNALKAAAQARARAQNKPWDDPFKGTDVIELLVENFEKLVLPLWPVGQPQPDDPDGSARVSYDVELASGDLGQGPSSVLRISLTRPGADAPCTGA